MTSQEKAKELVDKFSGTTYKVGGMLTAPDGKALALICVDEIIGSYSQYKGMYDQEFFDSELSFWEKVKEEIKRLS